MFIAEVLYFYPSTLINTVSKNVNQQLFGSSDKLRFS
ncbi:hypothetical protein T4C_6646 [Trichinella pseudospiralis]|uniref:Uncharacterized protein n=1 Tax=Trichinella pseudospiralis TaxID=6337 RepID=A0A0V1GWL7_TRIPS|nr:hypothetical protein T4C_6646 [Trichinella pseudospiralis]